MRIPPLLSFSDTARDRTTGCRPGIRHDESEFLFRVDNYEIGDKRHRTRECDAKGSCAIGVQGLIALLFLFSLKNAPACTFGSGAVWYARDFSGLRGPLPARRFARMKRRRSRNARTTARPFPVRSASTSGAARCTTWRTSCLSIRSRETPFFAGSTCAGCSGIAATRRAARFLRARRWGSPPF